MPRLVRRLLVFFRLVPPPQVHRLSTETYDALLDATIRQHREDLREIAFPPRPHPLLAKLLAQQRASDNSPQE